jgi:hypothetical protein
MTRASKSINLVLISSALILTGCRQPATTRPADSEREAGSTSTSGGHGVYHRSGGVYVPYYGGRSGGSPAPGGGAKSGSVSPHGGFGGAGHAMGGS